MRHRAGAFRLRGQYGLLQRGEAWSLTACLHSLHEAVDAAKNLKFVLSSLQSGVATPGDQRESVRHLPRHAGRDDVPRQALDGCFLEHIRVQRLKETILGHLCGCLGFLRVCRGFKVGACSALPIWRVQPVQPWVFLSWGSGPP